MPTPRWMPKLVLTALAAALPVLPTLGAEPVEGKNYRQVLPPQPSDSPGKIEVLEFFSYACPHCNEFRPLLTAWLAKQGKDVVLRRIPAGYDRPPWIVMQHTFYALQATGDLNRLDGPLFSAIHEQHRRLFDMQSIADWVGANGGNSEGFTAAFNSFGVNNQIAEADHLGEVFAVEGVPTMAVDGKYVALGDTFEDILANTDLLIAKVRAQLRTAHPAAAATPAKH
jgi:protein dithiol oxidoreductase (disulfide-forming)